MNLEEIIKRLSEYEAYLLYCICHDVPYKTIEKERRFSVATITSQVKVLYARLGVPDTEEHYTQKRAKVREHACPILEKLIEGNPENLKKFPINIDEPKASPGMDKETRQSHTDNSEEKGKVVEGKFVDGEPDGKKPEEPIKEPRRPSASMRIFRLVVFSIFAVGALVGVSYFSYRLGVSRMSSQITPEIPQSSNSPIGLSTTGSAPVQPPNEDPTSTYTPNPTNTNTPPPSTETSTLTPTENPSVFFYDFENGIDPAWVVVYGNPRVVNGQLTSNEPTLLSIGDPSWTNYELEMDLDPYGCLVDEYSNYLAVRARDIDNFLYYMVTTCKTHWGYKTNGQSYLLEDTKTDGLTTDGWMHITIRVEGNKVTMHEHARLISSFIDEDFPSGYIYLKVQYESYFDNIKITLLP